MKKQLLILLLSLSILAPGLAAGSDQAAAACAGARDAMLVFVTLRNGGQVPTAGERIARAILSPAASGLRKTMEGWIERGAAKGYSPYLAAVLWQARCEGVNMGYDYKKCEPLDMPGPDRVGQSLTCIYQVWEGAR